MSVTNICVCVCVYVCVFVCVHNFVILYYEDVARWNETLVNLFKYISNRLNGYSFNSFELGSYLYSSSKFSIKKIHRNKRFLVFKI